MKYVSEHIFLKCASFPTLKLSEKERQTIIKVFAQDNEVVLAAELEGLHNDMAHDEKDYIFIQHDDEKVLLKKVTELSSLHA